MVWLVPFVVAVPLGAQTLDSAGSRQDEGVLTSAREAASIPDTIGDESVQQETPPERVHTGWASLVKDTAGDFAELPKRRSTSALLAAGAGGAFAAHQADDYVEHRIVGSERAPDVFVLGKWVRSAYAQVGAGVGL